MILTGIICCELAQPVLEPLEPSSVCSTTCRCSTSLLDVAWRYISAWWLCVLLLIPSLDLSANLLEFKLEWGWVMVLTPHLKEFFWGTWFPGHISNVQEIVIEGGCIIKMGNLILSGKIRIVSWYSKRTCERHRVHCCAVEADSQRLLKSTCRKWDSWKH